MQIGFVGKSRSSQFSIAGIRRDHTANIAVNQHLMPPAHKRSQLTNHVPHDHNKD